MSLRVEKGIWQYSLPQLLDVLSNPEHPKFKEAEAELVKRNPTEEEKEKAEEALVKLQFYRNKAANASLTIGEKIGAMLAPFLRRHTHQESEFEKRTTAQFDLYGEDKKRKQYQDWQSLGYVFYLILVGAVYFIIQAT